MRSALRDDTELSTTVLESAPYTPGNREPTFQMEDGTVLTYKQAYSTYWSYGINFLSSNFGILSVEKEDILQDAFMKVYEKSHAYIQGTNFKKWFNAVLRNTAINRVRKISERPDDSRGKGGWTKYLVEYDEDAVLESLIIAYKNERTVGESIDSQHSIKNVLAVMYNLPPQFRDTFFRNLYGFKNDQIAAMENVKFGTIKSRINRTIPQLVDLLGDKRLDVDIEYTPAMHQYYSALFASCVEYESKSKSPDLLGNAADRLNIDFAEIFAPDNFLISLLPVINKLDNQALLKKSAPSEPLGTDAISMDSVNSRFRKRCERATLDLQQSLS
jgi:RNA polymerase sigma factor (sigma-70 family)